ncbi:MAG: hypothetical protein H7Y38_07255 [Armatimonadetes bacterium]|nr:hypothetical protein [Armatimonadota bacterium]
MVSETSAPALALQRTCSGCFLTESELRETGLFGCARCYETFAASVALAAEKLHGVRVPNVWSEPAPTRPLRAVTNPWPTRRAVTISSTV